MSLPHHVNDNEQFLTSRTTMSATTLSEQVIGARSRLEMTMTRLQELSGLSARTLRDIESGNPGRRYAPTTLARLDKPLGWPVGTAWRHWVEQSTTTTPDIGRFIEVERRLAQLEEGPAWSREVMEVATGLSSADRALWLELGRRLQGRS